MTNESKFSADEIEKAKKNTFILLGNTGNGKSTVTNLLCKSKAEVTQSKISVTKKAESYYGKLDDGNYFCIIDTPGFSDSGGKDRENYESIKNYLIDSKSLIKGIYVICNFQDERFNDAEQKSVKAISDLFPLQKFWNYVSIVFTHYFNKGCDSRVKIKNSGVFKDSLKQTKEKLIQDICKRNCIDPISEDKINTLYVDIYDNIQENNINDLDDDEKEEELESLNKKKKENEKAYKELIKDLKNKIIQNPLYDKVEIIPNEKVTLYEKNDKTTFTSYNLYDTEIEKRLFYLNNELLALDLRQKNEPKFRENVNKLLHDIKSVFIINKKLDYILDEKAIGLMFSISFSLYNIYSRFSFISLNSKKFKELFLKEYEEIKKKESIF